MPYSQLPYGAFHLHVSVSLLTLSGLNTNKWMELIVDAETHLVDLHAPLLPPDSGQQSQTQQTKLHTSLPGWVRICTWMMWEMCSGYSSLYLHPSGRPTSLKFNKLFYYASRVLHSSLSESLFWCSLYIVHPKLWPLQGNFFFFFILACFEAWVILIPRPGIKPLRVPTIGLPGNFPQWFLNMGLLPLPTLQLGPLDICELMGGVTP